MDATLEITITLWRIALSVVALTVGCGYIGYCIGRIHGFDEGYKAVKGED